MDHFWQTIVGLLERLFLCWSIVDQDEQAVRTFCGCRPAALGPGFHMYWPVLGFIEATPASEQVLDISSQSLTTSDHQVILVGVSVAYAVIDPVRAIYRVIDRDESIANETLGIVQEFVSTHTYAECARTEPMMQHLLTEIRKIVTERWGCKVFRVRRTDFAKHRVLRLVNDPVV